MRGEFVVLHITLFDEDPTMLSDLRTILNKKGESIQVTYQTDYEHFTQQILNEKMRPDAVFMGLKHENKALTINRAEELSNLFRNLPILYVAEDNSIWDQTILFGSTNLAGFMTLPTNENVLDRYLQKIINLKEGDKLLTVKSNGKESSVRVADILYLESKKHLAYIIADRGKITTYAKLSELLPKLPGNFIQPHKSYLVNADRISIVELNNLILDDGTSIPISRSRKSEVKEKLLYKMVDIDSLK